MDLRDVRSRLAFVTFETLRNVRASGFPSKYAPCKNPASQSFTVNPQSRRRSQRKTHTKVLLAQRFACEPQPAEGSAQVRVMRRDEA